MSGTTTGGGPPHNPVQNPNPAPVTEQDVLDAFDALRATLLRFIAERHSDRIEPAQSSGE